jgi:hypothetical protein
MILARLAQLGRAAEPTIPCATASVLSASRSYHSVYRMSLAHLQPGWSPYKGRSGRYPYVGN